MGEEKLALNEILSETYYAQHLLEKDREPLRKFVEKLGAGMKRLPCGIYAVGSSTWTPVICSDHQMQFPRRYNDIDLIVSPVQESEMAAVERELLGYFRRAKIRAKLDKTVRQVGQPEWPSGYVHLDYAHTVETKLTSGTEIDMIIRPRFRKDTMAPLDEVLQGERNFDPKRKVFAFSVLYKP